MKLLSIVVPCFNEEENIELFYSEVMKYESFLGENDLEMEMLFIDDLIEEMFDALEGREHHCEFDGVNTVPSEDGRYCLGNNGCQCSTAHPHRKKHNKSVIQ